MPKSIDITDNEFDEIVFGDDYEAVTSEEISDQSRWSTFYSQVFKKEDDGTFWKLEWQRGSTEYQDCDLEATKIQVYPKEVTVIQYVDEF